jgi:quinolinate synthase
MGYDPETQMVLWNPHLPDGGTDADTLRRSTMLLWKGHCSVHARFTTAQIAKARQEYPNVRVIVHPECTLDVVQAADQNGSTEYILREVSQAPAGTVWAIGTEVNLVNRLQQEHPEQTIFCLDPVICPCSTMYRIHPHYLLWVLENLVEGRVVNQVSVKPDIKAGARLSLQRMLDIA